MVKWLFGSDQSNNISPFHHYFQHRLKNKNYCTQALSEISLCLSSEAMYNFVIHFLVMFECHGKNILDFLTPSFKTRKMWLGENFVKAICNISSMLIMYQKNTQTQVSLHQVSLLFIMPLCMIGLRECYNKLFLI